MTSPLALLTLIARRVAVATRGNCSTETVKDFRADLDLLDFPECKQAKKEN